MATIVTRSGKGSPLTNTEVDANFTNLNTDKLESAITVDVSIDGDLTFPTDHEIVFGDNSDFKIFHNSDGAGNSIIRDMNGHNLWIQTDGNIAISKRNAAKYYIICFADQGVQLRYNNGIRLETTSSGVSISGDLAITTDLAVAHGGTGASTAANARTNLNVDEAGTALALSIALG
tara:strand:+ start:4078 stop:4605 length:528 start_codon:yes stop_codon:yes gene_type:complete